MKSLSDNSIQYNTKYFLLSIETEERLSEENCFSLLMTEISSISINSCRISKSRLKADLRAFHLRKNSIISEFNIELEYLVMCGYQLSWLFLGQTRIIST